MKEYKYSWSKAYAVSAQVAGEIIQRCKSTDALLAEAAKPSCPLHSLFEWDDSKAAREYRLVQARVMVASLKVEVITLDRKVEQVPAFVSKVDKPGFVPTLEANAEELTGAEQACWAEAVRFRAKWKGLKFAHTIVEAIADVERSVARKGRAR